MIGQNEYSPRANMLRVYGAAFCISLVLHMPFLPLQFINVFGGANALFIIFSIYDVLFLFGSAFMLNVYAGVKSPQLIMCLIWGIIGFIVDFHNGIYIISKVNCTDDFHSPDTWDISEVLLILGFIFALCTTQ